MAERSKTFLIHIEGKPNSADVVVLERNAKRARRAARAYFRADPKLGIEPIQSRKAIKTLPVPEEVAAHYGIPAIRAIVDRVNITKYYEYNPLPPIDHSQFSRPYNKEELDAADFRAELEALTSMPENVAQTTKTSAYSEAQA